jgi:DNA-binding transcriptional LysR family regulator
MQEPLETAELLAFAKIVESKSLSRAAIALRVPRATISRRLARLEERLGVRLLRRTTRSMVITDAGEALYGHAKVVLDALAKAEESLRHRDGKIRGDLRISMLPIRSEAFSAMLLDFMRNHPEVRLYIHASTRHVDLRRDPYDVAIRGTSGPIEPGLIARVLYKSELLAVASPEYLAARGRPKGPRDLAGHRCLLGFARGESPMTHWPAKGLKPIPIEGALYCNDLLLLVDACLDGQGIAMVPAEVVTAHLASRELVRVLPKVLTAPLQISLIYPERELTPPQVRAFIDTFAAWAAANLGKALVPPPGLTSKRLQ